ncbi:MAG: Rpn family recombination-promoting nuclease/putative transposase [Treponema sp.]|nr:Rpn family recombination-promoting nuclease/putative transposase [Treponema sp.]
MKTLFKRSQYLRELKQLVRENAADGMPLSILDDAVFKAMLTSDNDNSREALRCLLGACIGREVCAARILNNDLVPAHLAGKSPRLDVHVTFNDGEVANLEMQISKHDDDLKARASIHAAMLLSGQSRRGGSYSDIKRVYQIFFLNCVLFPHSCKVSRRYSYREAEEHDRLSELTEIIFYEMPKLEQKVANILSGATTMDSLPEDEKWCMYMKYRHEKHAEGLIEKLYRQEEGIMRAEQAVTGISKDYMKYARKMAELKNSMDRAQELYSARKRARAEGRADGHAEGEERKAIDIARKMKEMGYPVEKIHIITGLPTETIEDLKP